MVLQLAMDADDMATRSVAIAITMRWTSWLLASRVPQEVQATIENVPFERMEL